MFENVGEKIKSIAKFVCWGGIVADIIIAIIIFIAADEDYYNQETYVLIGLICLIVGPVLSWISSLLLYAFGEITDALMRMSPPKHQVDFKKFEKMKMKKENEKEYKQEEYKQEEYKQEEKKEVSLNTLKKWKELGMISNSEFRKRSKSVKK